MYFKYKEVPDDYRDCIDEASDRLFFRSSPMINLNASHTPLRYLSPDNAPLISPCALPPPKILSFLNRPLISRKVVFEDFDQDSLQKTP